MDNDIKAIIWDMGGVLLRTEDPHPRAALASRLDTPLEELYRFVFASPTARQAELGAINAEEHWQTVCQHYGLSNNDLDQYQEEFWGGDRVDQSLVDSIRSLRAHYRTALLSNAWSDARHLAGDLFHFLDAFDVCIFSAEVGISKPSPEIYLLVLKKLDVLPEQAIFIDDTPANVEGAEQVGIHAIRFISHSQVMEELKGYIS
jgi:epoxide hydrolase-like predicted phosphatase